MPCKVDFISNRDRLAIVDLPFMNREKKNDHDEENKENCQPGTLYSLVLSPKFSDVKDTPVWKSTQKEF